MNLRYQPSESAQVAGWRRQLNTLRQQADAWWKERTPQERKLLCLGAAVIAVALVWTQGLQPALRTIAQSRELLPRLHADAAQVDALILEAQFLQRKQAGKIDAADLPQALRASLKRAGLEESSTLDETGHLANSSTRQWEIGLTNANAARVMEWLAALPYLLQLQTQSADLTRTNIDGRDRPGYVSGRIVVHQAVKRNP